MDQIKKLITEYKREIQQRQKALELHKEFPINTDKNYAEIHFKAKKEVLLRIIKDLEDLNTFIILNQTKI